MAKYKNIKKIGEGGLCCVWQCSSNEDEKMYAKKKLKSETDESDIKRFQREVRILSRLDHPNIVKVIGKHLSDSPYFYIMPIYKSSLANEIPIIVGNDEKIGKIFLSVLDAIDYAHKQGIIHRDLKPLNILLNSYDDVVVSDFGFGRDFGSESSRITLSGDGFGTLPYMAPELINDAKNADERSDIFSLGRIVHELYSGSVVYGNHDTSGLPPEIAILVKKCTYFDPSHRYQTVSDLKNAWVSIFNKFESGKSRVGLTKLIKKLSSGEDATVDEAENLITGLLKFIDDEDFLQDTLMSISPGTFSLFEAANIEGFRIIINAFVDYITSQSWPFGFTDDIGNRCEIIFLSTSDPEIRAKLTYCVAEVGISHNRWHVMSIAGEMICKAKAPDDAIAVREQFEDQKHIIQRLEGYFEHSNLHEILLPLFEKGE